MLLCCKKMICVGSQGHQILCNASVGVRGFVWRGTHIALQQGLTCRMTILNHMKYMMLKKIPRNGAVHCFEFALSDL